MKPFKLSLATTVQTTHPEDKVLANASKILNRDIHSVLTTTSGRNVIQLEKINNFYDADDFNIIQTEDDVLKIQASTSLGVMYGVLAFTRELLGIDDCWYFLDVIPKKKEFINVMSTQFIMPDYRVKYRGWFVNDEVMISQWKDHDSHEYVWERIYETLLRLGGNLIIPGTDQNSHINRQSASNFGLMTAHHHAEPLGAQMFARVYPDLEPSYLKYPELFKGLWQESILEQKDNPVLWGLGFRGQGDRPFWDDDKSKVWTEEEKAKLINSVIKLQYDMVKDVDEQAICAVNIYGELTKMYNEKLLILPSDVIEIWADNGYGKMVSRRQGEDDPRSEILSNSQKKGNKRGIYYHVAFHDLQASNFLSKLPNSPSFVSKELSKVRTVDMDTLVITNTGNIKPHILFLQEIAKFWLSDYQERSNEDIFNDYMKYYPVEAKNEIKSLYIELFNCFIQYGMHDDQKAGDEFYTYTIRKLVKAILKQDDVLKGLRWLTGSVMDIDTQLSMIQEKVQSKIMSWEELHKKAQLLYISLNDKEIRERFYNDLLLDIINHYRGCKALLYTLQAYQFFRMNNVIQAFLETYKAKQEIVVILDARKNNPSNKWNDFYRGDVFTNMELTKRVLDTLLQFFRIVGDNHDQNQWERNYLMEPGEATVMLLSNNHDALSNDNLGSKLLDCQHKYLKPFEKY